MVSEVSPLQPSNAPLPIEVTEFGMVNEVSPLQPSNATKPMEVTEYVVPSFVTVEGMDRSPVGSLKPS